MGEFQVSLNSLDDVVMDLRGIEAMLTVMESSEYYQNGADCYVCRGIRNSVTEAKRKLMDAMGDYYTVQEKAEEN